MADIKKLAEELTKLTVLEVNELKNILKDEYGIEPAAAAVAVAGPAAGDAGAGDADGSMWIRNGRRTNLIHDLGPGEGGQQQGGVEVAVVVRDEDGRRIERVDAVGVAYLRPAGHLGDRPADRRHRREPCPTCNGVPRPFGVVRVTEAFDRRRWLHTSRCRRRGVGEPQRSHATTRSPCQLTQACSHLLGAHPRAHVTSAMPSGGFFT